MIKSNGKSAVTSIDWNQDESLIRVSNSNGEVNYIEKPKDQQKIGDPSNIEFVSHHCKYTYDVKGIYSKSLPQSHVTCIDRNNE